MNRVEPELSLENKKQLPKQWKKNRVFQREEYESSKMCTGNYESRPENTQP